MAGRAILLSKDKEASVLQDVVSSAHRAFDARDFGVRAFPGFLAECIEKRVWEQERRLENGGVQGPTSFEDFIRKPYPVGLGSTYQEIEGVIAENHELAAHWEELTGRCVGTRAKMLGLDSIRLDVVERTRAKLDDETVKDYMATLDELPPAVVFHDGEAPWMADGLHRFHAHRQAGREKIKCEVRDGDVHDARLFAAGANRANALRRSNADKRACVVLLLTDEKWSKFSDRTIAEHAGVHHDTVATVRRQLADSASSDPGSRTGKDGKTRKSPKPRAPKPKPKAAATPDEPSVATGSPTLIDQALALVQRMTPAELEEFEAHLQMFLESREESA